MSGFFISQTFEVTPEEARKLRRRRWKRVTRDIFDLATQADESAIGYLCALDRLETASKLHAGNSSRALEVSAKLAHRAALADICSLAVAMRQVMTAVTRGMVVSEDLAGAGLGHDELRLVSEMAGWPATRGGEANRL